MSESAKVPANLPETALDLTPNALSVLAMRYLKREDGKPCERPEDMFRRVAHNIASVESSYDPGMVGDELQALEDKFYRMMAEIDFLPNSPTLMNAGRELQQLSACFVLPIEDSMDSIFEAVKNAALVHKSGGGTGFSFSKLRPQSDRVQTTGGVASGPISFMKVFDSATGAVTQGGTRRGANMGILRVDHPDILQFVTAKQDTTELTNFNISVAVTEVFMEAVAKGEKYGVINPRTQEVVKELDAREVFNLIIRSAWETGEPGMIFLDRINQDNPTPQIGEIESTNPCGEQPLLPNEACNLGSINLARMVIQENGRSAVDWEKLRSVIKLGVRFLDDVIDMNLYPLPVIEEMAKGNRKIGLGVMGWADLLVQLSIPYDSDQALQLGEKLMEFFDEEAKLASADLAEQRGVFLNFEGSIYDRPDGMRLRNATVTTIAPTGSLSIIAGCSSGIEPLFAVSYIRTALEDVKLVEVNRYFEQIAQREGFYSQELMERIARQGIIQDMPEAPEWVQRIFVTAHDISPEWHVQMQAAFQKHTDNAVSKTVNFPADATVDDVRRVFGLAYESGCKGITVYRDRSRDRQVLSVERGSKSEERKIVPRKRPQVTIGRTEKVITGCGNLYVTINEDSEGLCELFTQMGKCGGCAQSQSEATARLISLALRAGVDVESIIKHLRGIRCPNIAWHNGGTILSCPDAIGIALEHYLMAKQTGGLQNVDVAAEAPIEPAFTSLMGACPDCGAAVEYDGGCVVCRVCGYSRCG